jgi:hypothetical protein
MVVERAVERAVEMAGPWATSRVETRAGPLEASWAD